MKNFIRFNIENVKGTRKPASWIDKEPRDLSHQKTKPKQGFRQHRSIEQRVQRMEEELTGMGSRNDWLIEEIS